MSEDFDVPPPTALAAEIHAEFTRKMEPGGALDQILSGRVVAPKGPPLPDAEIGVIQRSINAQLDEYEAAIAAAGAWMRGWLARRPKGFRATRKPKPAPVAPAETVGEGAE